MTRDETPMSLRAEHSRSRVRENWRRFADLISAYHWWILLAAGAVAFALGWIGWRDLMIKHHTRGDWAFLAYWSLKSFLANSPSEQVIPWQLNVNRFLAPLVAGWAGYSALAVLFRDRIQQMRIPLMRRHVVVCGLGQYVGTVFVRVLRDRNIRVVVVEKDVTNPNIELCRSLGVPVIIGDAQRPKTLQAAGAHHAWRVLALTDDDAVNTQIVATWQKLPGVGSTEAGCLAMISDPDYCSLLRLQQARSGRKSWVDFFNIDEIAARKILKQFPFDTTPPQPHILVGHLDPLGVWVVWHAARLWHDISDKTTPLLVTVVDNDPEASVAALTGRYPALKQHCEFTTVKASVGHIREALPALHHDAARVPISRAYVTAYQDRQAFETALRLHHELRGIHPPVPVVLALSRPHGVNELLADAKDAGALDGLDVFATMDKTISVGLLRGGSFEPLAEAFHERYNAQRTAQGKSVTLWENLDEPMRESNRRVARHTATKLETIGCGLSPLQDWDAKAFEFTPEELELLAIAEHDRWEAERRADHWKLIPMPVGTDDADSERLLDEAKKRRESPYLIPWPELLERFPDMAEYDRVFVREIPEFAARLGLQVIRIDAP